jgi:hypothetical protein
MISSITANSQIAQAHQTQQQQNVQAQKPSQKPSPDSVVLSKQASGAGDVDHDGDSH